LGLSPLGVAEPESLVRALDRREELTWMDRVVRIKQLNFKSLIPILFILSILVKDSSVTREIAVTSGGACLSAPVAAPDERVGHEQAEGDFRQRCGRGRAVEAAAKVLEGRALVAEAEEVFGAGEAQGALVACELSGAQFEVWRGVALGFEPRLDHPDEVATGIRAVAAPGREHTRVEGELAVGTQLQVQLIVFKPRPLVPAVPLYALAPVN